MAKKKYQYAFIPIKDFVVSQSRNVTPSHYGTEAIDFGGAPNNKGRHTVYAPFDCVVTAIEDEFGGVFIESLDSVGLYTPSGYKDKLSMVFLHNDWDDENPNKIVVKKGQVVLQGQPLTQMGSRAFYKRYYQIHVHVECDVGKNTNEIYDSTTTKGAHTFPNPPHMETLLYKANDTNDHGANHPEEVNWKWVKAPNNAKLFSTSTPPETGETTDPTPEPVVNPKPQIISHPNPKFMQMLQVNNNAPYYTSSAFTTKKGTLSAGQYALLETLYGGYKAVVNDGIYYVKEDHANIIMATVDEVKNSMKYTTAEIQAMKTKAEEQAAAATAMQAKATDMETQRKAKEAERDQKERELRIAEEAVRAKWNDFHALQSEVEAGVEREQNNITQKFTSLFAWVVAFMEDVHALVKVKTKLLIDWVMGNYASIKKRIVSMRSPYSGKQMPMQDLWEDVFMTHRAEGITAQEYENIKLLATVYSTYNISAFDYATKAKTIWQSLLEEYQQNTLTATMYDALCLTAQAYANYALTAEMYDTAAKLHLI